MTSPILWMSAWSVITIGGLLGFFLYTVYIYKPAPKPEKPVHQGMGPGLAVLFQLIALIFFIIATNVVGWIAILIEVLK